MPPKKRTTTAPHERTQTEKITQFDAFRQRATGYDITDRQREPYVLAADEGFDPPITARFPTSLQRKVELDLASRHNDTIAVLVILLGEQQLLQVVRAFEPFDDSEQLLFGLMLRLKDHYLGAGAGDVPGGTPAS